MSLQLGIPLFLVAMIVQASILPHLRVFGGQPDLIVLLVLAWSTLDDGQEGMAWAFTGGLFLDLLSGAPLGISSLALVPIAYLVGLTEAQVYRNNVALPLLLGFAGTLGYHVLYLLLLRFLAGFPVDWTGIIWYVTVPSILFDMIFILPILRVLARWYARLHPRQVTI